MSDIEEHSLNHQTNNDHTTTTNSTIVIRYSKDVLLSLHDSPLVSKPDNMPSLSSWFSEETGSPAVSKNILNGSVSSRSSDKSIVLGPPKTNFASSLYGGLKHTTYTNNNAPSSTTKLSSSSSRLRQSEDSTRTHNNNSNGNRMPRGPNYVGEKSFHHYNYNNNNNSNNSTHQYHNNRQDKSGLERRSSNSYGNSSSHSKRYNSHSDHHHQGERQPMNSSTGTGRREFNRDQRPSNRQNHNDDRNQERVPEWMDYNPDAKKTSDSDEPRGEFANDLEAWKSNMKKKEGLPESLPLTPVEDPLSQTNEKNTNNDSMEKIMGLGSLELKPSSSSSSTAPFLDSTTLPSSDLPTKRGSRFAKFFAKREEAAQTSPSSPLTHENQDPQPRSISVNDLFQTPIGNPSQPQAITGRELNGSHHHEPSPSNTRMLSEDDVLQTLGAKKSSSAEPPVNDSDKNAMGFNKVLQILSQSKPTVPVSPSMDTNIPSPSSKGNSIQDQEMTTENGSPTVKQQLPEMTSPSQGTPATKPKKVSNLFGGNLPTSVLRQMSARSEGRSPSIASNKSGHSGRFSHSTTNSQNGSPLIGNASPSSTHLPVQPQPQPQQPQSPSNYGYQQGYPMRTTTTTQPNVYPYHHDMEGADRPMMMNDMMLMNPHIPRNQQVNGSGYDRMVQQLYGDAGIRPLPLHQQSGSNMNGQMNRIMSPTQQQQQQQQQQQPFMNPPPPPMMGMPGAHPMMSPHMRLQGQAGNAAIPFMQQPLMPGMPPPPPPPMGMPQQQMYANKNHGWNRQ